MTSNKNPRDKLGFGCGRIVGGASLRQSALVLEHAYGLGIRHFDVAPSYGLGTAEDVVGHTFNGDLKIKIATKVGIARPANPKGLSVLRKYVGPLLKSSKFLTSLALKSLSSQAKRGLFDDDFVQASLTDSLTRLKRSKVDYLLLHEPSLEDVTPGLKQCCQQLVSERKIGRLGTAFSRAQVSEQFDFGDVQQHNFGSFDSAPVESGKYQIVHGVFRSGLAQLPQRLEQDQELTLMLTNMGINPNESQNYAGIALALALHNESHDKVLVSYSDMQRMETTLNMAEDIYFQLQGVYQSADRARA